MIGLSRTLERHSGRVLSAVVVLTLLLAIPFVGLENDTEASQNPGGEVFDLQDEIDELFEPVAHVISFVVEAKGGDILTQATLVELYQNQERLKALDREGRLGPEGLPAQPYLLNAFDTNTGRPFTGVTSIADAVQGILLTDSRLGTGLESATDEQVKLAIHYLFASEQTRELRESLSVQATSEPRVVAGQTIDHWVSPAVIVVVTAENEKLGGGASRGGLDASDRILDKEEFNRNVQEVLRGDERTYQAWGIAIDQNLEAQDEGQTAGMFIMFTVVAAIAIVGIALRSVWAVVLTGVGLGALIIWLKGISNLVGLEGGLVIDLIVPIAMISLGVDFVIHAMRRYQEERQLGYDPRAAARVGMAGVLGALMLAMLSTSVAFLANTSSGIEAVVHFGVAASIAVASSFVILGVAVPLAMMRIELLARGEGGPATVRGRVFRVLAAASAASLAGTAVILMVAVSAVAGIAVLMMFFAWRVLLPVYLLRRRHGGETTIDRKTATPATDLPHDVDVHPGRLATAIVWVSRYPVAVLLVAAIVTAAAALYATKLEATFDVKDFFDSGSDFVVGLDKLDEHVAERGGEPAIIYVRGDLADPDALAAIADFEDRISANPYVAKRSDGRAETRTTVLNGLSQLTASAYAREQVAAETGTMITDTNGDGIPDSKAQIQAAFDYMVGWGVPRDQETLVYTPAQVRQMLFHVPGGVDEDVTVIVLGIPGSRWQDTVASAEDALLADLRILGEAPSISSVGLTGSPFQRLKTLQATTDALQRSLPIAAGAVLVILLIAMRSVRYALVTLVPVGLVVAWLYAIMYAAGFALNFVTATIGAISIGVGIDFSIHMTARFREELGRSGSKALALARALGSTGMALVASAGSSIVGFLIMAMAPMPMFATYGLLTAVMILLALVASVVVLPSLLVLVTREPNRVPASDVALER